MDIGPAVEVTLVNTLDVPLVVESTTGACGNDFFRILRGDEPVQWSTPCLAPCEAAFEGGDACDGCPDSEPYLLLEPGAVYRRTWDGNIDAEQRPPDACFSTMLEQHCVTQRQADAGSYDVRAVAFFDAECEQPDGIVRPCECQSDEPCSVWPLHKSLEETGATGSFEYPTATDVELRFD